MRLIDSSKLIELQSNPSKIRNICILAHVDHGKTTLADSLVASNGIISSKLAGKLRYLDSRPDEQQRGITMKSSSISLYHNYNDDDYLINVIDSPGHVDFASEVSTAVRLCDGAIVVVDVVEGVCPQTRSALSMTYVEGLKPLLILNKIDRLITEIKLEPIDAYLHINQLLEQINAVMGEIFASDIMDREDKEELPISNKNNDDLVNDNNWQSALEDVDDSSLYFSPEQGNVLFTSAVDGWGFGISEFAKIYSEKLGFSEKVLLKTLWGDYYLNVKAKRIMKGAQEKAKKPLFVSLILENLWTIYDTVTVRKDKEKMISMIDKMNIKLTTRDLRVTDSKVQLQAIFSQWLPLSKSCIDAICDKVPAPHELSSDKIERLMCGNSEFGSLPPETQRLKDAFLACDSSEKAPIIAFVSKMFSVDRKMLPEFKTKPLTQEELTKRREIARQRHAIKLEREQNPESAPSTSQETPELVEKDEEIHQDENREHILIAFARVYSGTIQEGSEVFVLGPKHNPRTVLEKSRSGEIVEAAASLKDLRSGWHITKVKIPKMYLMMGRELEAVTKVPAGNVLGIGGLEEHVLKTATISTEIMCPSFSELTSLSDPILRVALEPKHPNDLQRLINGLKMLNQADACAVMHIQETGEIVLNTAGEVHLERCLEDLKLRYAGVDINVSEPIVAFRETVVPSPTVDMVNEAIEKKNSDEILEFWTANRQFYFEIDAKPLPDCVTKLIERNSELIKDLDQHWEKFGKEENEEIPDFGSMTIEDVTIGDRKQKALVAFKSELISAFKVSGWEEDVIEKIWSFGPRKCGPNILLNQTDYKRRAFWEGQVTVSDDPRAAYDNSMINGFQLATLAGPLCEEPMMGVCFVVKKWEIHDGSSSESGLSQGHLGGQLMSTFKEACRRALSLRRPRLVTPMYSCSVLVTSDVLGVHSKSDAYDDTAELSLAQSPHAASIWSRNEYHCNGAIISYSHIITAGHCVNYKFSYELLVAVGVTQQQYIYYDMYPVEYIHVHPDLNAVFNAADPKNIYWVNDIAVLKLGKELIPSQTIQPIPLGNSEYDWNNAVSCVVSGWYLNIKNGAKRLISLEQSTATALINEQCHQYNIQLFINEKCTEDVFGSSILNENSGAPLVCDGTLEGIIIRRDNTRSTVLQIGPYADFIRYIVNGKLYAVFGRRQGRIIAADSAGFGGQFRVLATLPVPESFQLARELRTQTSGLASPQLVFSHWEVIEQDPFWVPSTEEEYLHFGEKADSANRAKKYIDAVRRRKGLPVDSQLVTHGEKQRTLSKKK